MEPSDDAAITRSPSPSNAKPICALLDNTFSLKFSGLLLPQLSLMFLPSGFEPTSTTVAPSS